MENNDKILLEQSFRYSNLSEEQRNICISLLLGTKDINDSYKNASNRYYSTYDLLTLHLVNNNGVVSFEAFVCNEKENRFISGYIVYNNNNYYVDTTVERLTSDIKVKNEEYNVTDIFVYDNSDNGTVTRRSHYDSGEYFEDIVVLMNNDEVEDYLQNKVDEMKERKI